MDDLDPEIKDQEDVEEEVEEELTPGTKKPKGPKDADETTSLDDLVDEEEEVLPEDSFDDVDLW